MNMDDDWEALADDAPVIPSLGSTKESWEDEEDEALKELQQEKVLSEKLKELPKPIKEDKPKPAPKKKTPIIEEGRALTAEEKAAMLEMEKKSDYENARDLFGGIDDGHHDRDGDANLSGKTIDDFKPKSDKEFEEFATMLAAKITPFSREYFYRAFVRSLLSKITDSLTPEDLKEISKHFDSIINEKLKKQSNKKKKPTAKVVARAIDSDEEEDLGGDEYDGFM